jgi:hypothetical protein
MNKSIAIYVRGTFALFLLGMGMYAGLDSLAEHALAGRGLSTCGAADNPCALAPLQVITPAAVAAGRKANDAATMIVPAAVVAPRATSPASAES